MPAVQSLLHKVKDGLSEDERGEWSLLCVSVTCYHVFFRKHNNCVTETLRFSLKQCHLSSVSDIKRQNDCQIYVRLRQKYAA